MGANASPESIQKAGKSIAAVQWICDIFKNQTSSKKHSNSHLIPDFGRDFTTILEVLEEEEVFRPLSTARKHTSFKFSVCIMERFSITELIPKVDLNISKFTA